MNSCDYFKSSRQATSGSGGAADDHEVRGEGDIVVVETFEGQKKISTVSFQPYAPPQISFYFKASPLEKGLNPMRESLQLSLSVSRGRNDVTHISVPSASISQSNPALPYSQEFFYHETGPLGDTETPQVIGSVSDGRLHNISAILQRSTRVFFSLLDKDPRICAPEEIMAGAMQSEGGHKGQLLLGMPGSLSFPCNGKYWAIFVPAAWSFGMKTDLNFIPYQADKGAVIANPSTDFAQNYRVYCNNAPNFGTVTFSIF